MKIRTNFVSNSSSTSFILAAKRHPIHLNTNPNIDTLTLSEIADLFRSSRDGETELISSNIKDIEDELKERFSEDEFSNKDSKVLNFINEHNNEDWGVILVSLSYHDKALEFILDILGALGVVKTIDKWER